MQLLHILKANYCKNNFDKYVCKLTSLDLLTSALIDNTTKLCKLTCLECGGKCRNHNTHNSNKTCESCGFKCNDHTIIKNTEIDIFTCNNCKYICTNHEMISNVENGESSYLKYFTCNTCGIVCKIDGEGDDLIHKMEYNNEEFKCENCDKKHDILKQIAYDEIDKHPIFNKKVWDEYALKGASFLILETEYPGLMDDVRSENVARARYIERITRPIYKKLQLEFKLPWCIAVLPSKSWAKKLFPDLQEQEAYEKLFGLICKMCMADTENPLESWNNFL